MTKLSYLNEPGVLHNLKDRYKIDGIYTYTSNILIAVNPFFPVPQLYGDHMMTEYTDRPLGELSPHVYAIADNAYRKMCSEGHSQSVLISGESGAGKTETSKLIMNFLAFRGGHAASPGAGAKGGDEKRTVEQQVLQSNPILETFGNAKTVRNDNSSRFGKFMEIQFDSKNCISGAAIRVYLLERSRIVSVTDPERAYHSFYQLCSGASDEERAALRLQPAAEFAVLKKSSCFELQGVDNAQEYRRTREAMGIVGMSPAEQDFAWRVVAAVLHLGSVSFEETDDDGSRVSPGAGAEHLEAVAHILQVDSESLAKGLTTRTRQTFDGAITSPIRPAAAQSSRDSLAKNMYSKLFEWLVGRINASIGQDESSQKHIGVLDIYGFESFKHNDFEQFCINLANEKLQQHFNQHVFKMEQEEYEKEAIDWSYIEFVDNQDILDMIEKKPSGIIAKLDETCQFPQAKAEDFATKLYQEMDKEPRFSKPKISQTAFTLNHYAGEVTYESLNFLEKNKDYVVEDHQKVLMASGDELVVELFRPQPEAETGASAAAGAGGGRARRGSQSAFKFSSVSGTFKTQLGLLMQALNKTEPHYIRCIKPNNLNKPGIFENNNVLQQLRCGGVLEAIRIACAGFPSRRLFYEFVDRFGVLRPDLLDGASDDKAICMKILEDAGLEKYQVGKTKIFLRGGQMAVLDKLRQEKLNAAAVVIQRHVRGFVASRQFGRTKAAVLALQAGTRGMFARREARFRRQTKASIKIQTRFRGRAARKQYLQTRAAAVKLQSIARGAKARKKYKNIRKENAAVAIQSSWRGRNARREFMVARSAAVAFQCAWRSKKARAELKQLRVEARSAAGLLKDKQALKEKVGSLEENVVNLQSQKAELRAEVKQSKSSLADAHAEIERLKAELGASAALSADLARAQAETGEWQKKAAHLEEEAQVQADRLAGAEAQVAELRSAVEAAKASAAEQLATDEKLNGLQQELSAARGEVSAKQKEIDAAKTSREELELNYATLKHRIAELEQQVRTPKAVRPQRVLGNSSNVQQTPETPADGGSVARLKAASQASLAGLADPASSEARKASRASRDRSIAEQEKLMACVAEEIGFHKDRPLAACIIFRSLLHWEAFNAERTNVFDRIINTMGGLLEKQQENNEVLGYWLSNTVTLLALFRHHIKPPSDSGYSRKRNSVSYGASLFGGFRNSGSFFSRGGLSPAPNTPGSGVELSSSNDERLVEAKYPALLFKQQLDAYVQKIFSLIRDNVKREIAVPLHNCIHAPRTARGGGARAPRGSAPAAAGSSHWTNIMAVMDKLMLSMKANHVPQFLVRKLFTQVFAFINVQLFNQLLLRRECCSFSNGEYVKTGLTELENWIHVAGEDWVGKSSDELLQIRQAVGFLVIHQKPKKSLHEIMTDLCPVLSVQQLYRISTMYWDDKYGTETVSGEVLAQMKQAMVQDHVNSNGANSSFLLDDDPSVPFSFDDITVEGCDVDVYDPDLPVPEKLKGEGTFTFLTHI